MPRRAHCTAPTARVLTLAAGLTLGAVVLTPAGAVTTGVAAATTAGTVALSPVSAATGPGGLLLTATGQGGQVLLARQSATGWTGSTGRAVGPVAVAETPAGGVTVVVRSAGGDLWTSTDPARAGSWSLLAGGVSSAPAVADGAGGVLVAVADATGVELRSERDGRWQPWQHLAARLAAGSAPAVAADGDGFVLAVTGRGGRVDLGSWTAGRWSGWTPLGGATPAGPAVAVSGGAVTVATRSAAGQVWVRHGSIGHWSGWLFLGGDTNASGPALAATATTTSVLVTTAAGRALATRTLRAGRWSGWSVLPLTAPGPATSPQVAPSSALAVRGNTLVDADGDPVTLAGVNRSGTEYACAQGWGFFDGPSDQASVSAMLSWHVQIVRLPLNEDCWLGINGVNPAYSGASYRAAVAAYVALLRANGLYVDLDLHWSAPGTTLATGQQDMADEDHSPAFWSSVAATFRTDRGVAFELYNEPHDISWSCWLSGCTTAAGWRAAGMQQLLSAVRATGARNVVLVGGLDWASDDSQWLSHEPHDPVGQLAAAVHIYNFSGCSTPACWQTTLAPLATHVPLVTSEFGQSGCTGGFVTDYLDWADQARVSYLGWAWDTDDCSSGPALVSSYDGTPTGYGAAVRAHYLAR